MSTLAKSASSGSQPVTPRVSMVREPRSAAAAKSNFASCRRRFAPGPRPAARLGTLPAPNVGTPPSHQPAAPPLHTEVPREAPEPRPRAADPRDRDGDFNLRLYLREISETPLLSPAEEVALADRIHAGDAAAREHMIKANLRLVVKIAHDYHGLGLPLLDMINEGNMGLMRAVDRFDPRKGAKLSTYAAWWIKQSIKRALANQGKTIRLPVHLVDLVARLRRIALDLQEELGREPNEEEIAHAVGLPKKRVSELWQASHRTASLDAPIGEDEDSTYAEKVRDENQLTAYESVDNEATYSMVREFVDQLDEREAMIIRCRFGLDGGDEMTLEDIGRHFHVTRERIRQLQNVALSKLRKWIEKKQRVLDPDFERFLHAA